MGNEIRVLAKADAIARLAADARPECGGVDQEMIDAVATGTAEIGVDAAGNTYIRRP